MQYRNFDIELFGYKRHRDGPEEIRVRVVNSPAGQQSIGEATHAPPVTFGARLRLLVQVLEAGALRDMKQVVELGIEIGKVLFPEHARNLFIESHTRVRAKGDRLRVRLMLDPREQPALPWEYAYIPELVPGGPAINELNFLALNEGISVVRFRQFQGSLPISAPLKGAREWSRSSLVPAGTNPSTSRRKQSRYQRRSQGWTAYVSNHLSDRQKD
jgi:hypothetical protein